MISKIASLDLEDAESDEDKLGSKKVESLEIILVTTRSPCRQHN